MDLKTEQSKYRVFIDESYAAEKEEGKTREQWRYYELRGLRGTLYPYSETHLAMFVKGKVLIKKSPFGFKDATILQSGDEEIVLKVKNSELHNVAQFLKCRVKRIGNPELGRRLSKWQFKRSG